MGAWGHGPFDDDDAADFAGDLAEITDAEVVAVVLRDALLAVTASEGYVEGPDMSRAVAAASIVALFAGAGAPVPPSLSRARIDAVGLVPSDALRTEATQVFGRAFDPQDNEWYELWSESELGDEVRAATAPYSAALA
jgi:hypothetical protein